MVRRTALIQALIAAAIGALIFFYWHRPVAYVVWSIAGLTLLAGLLSPRGLYRKIEAFLERLGYWIGRAITVLTLVPLYLLFFTPFGLLLRRGRRDRLERWLDRGAPSYWRRREDPAPSLEAYKRQF